MKGQAENPPFEGNLIRAKDYAPCGCQGDPHWTITQGEGEAMHMTACPGRVAVEPYPGEGEVLGYKLLKGRR